MKRLIFAISMVILACVTSTVLAQVPLRGTVVRPAQAAAGPIVVPENFLRSWDPVTIFFASSIGSQRGEAEDHPEKYVTVTPAHPGAYTWLDSKTLQFRPADAWSPLQRFTWTVEGRETVLHTLMAAPIETIPAAGAEGLDEVDSITLSFNDEIDPVDLANMVSIEVRALPGVGDGRARWLNREDFVVKTIERSAPTDAKTYNLKLTSPIPSAHRAVVHLRLSLDDSSERSFTEISFATKQAFRVVNFGSRSIRYPVTPDGNRYSKEQALDAGMDPPVVAVEFSTAPAEISPVLARQLVRFTPAVDDLKFRLSGNSLEVSGAFAWDTLYRVVLGPSEIRDRSERTLEIDHESELYLFFPRRPAYLKWGASQGVVERFGPQMVPVEGRGHERFDLRIFKIDALDRSFWPFPERPIVVEESERPPGPGEEAPPFNELRHIRQAELHRHLTALPSPPVSDIIDLPLKKDGGAATFGLAISKQLAFISRPQQSGHYLVGLRSLDQGSERQWMRIQVTDLSLTVVEEPHEVRFFVTSLASGTPVAGASIRVEVDKFDSSRSGWRQMVKGVTDSEGMFRWLPSSCDSCVVLRIVVEKNDDILVLDPTRAPDGYADGQWSESYETWLQWTTSGHSWRGSQPEEVSHIFTERPMYRPDEPVYIKGYVRERCNGRLAAIPLGKTFVVIDGPGDLEWRFPVAISELGSFDWTFEADDRPTGWYSAHLEGWRIDRDQLLWSKEVNFQLEAYRIPRFQVEVHAPERMSLDRPSDVTMTATYYAGGRVAERPVEWRVTQFPYTWQPSGWPGFLFSSDGRYSRTDRFETTAALDSEDITDEEGSALITLDPTIEATAQPRTYVVEATVTGSDDQTVTSSRRVIALPPFVLGLKLDRYFERAAQIEPEILALGPDEKPVEGLSMTLRLKHRQWHSYLQASDFSDGEARYMTDVVDELVFEKEVISRGEIMKLNLPLNEAGVYVVELEARDRLGRAQVVSIDLYAGGDEAISWAKAPSKTFNVNTDRANYDPGDTVHFVVESPYQQAQMLSIVEAPEGNRYAWIPVVGGQATFSLMLESTWTPRIPVHFVLMRGRVDGTQPIPGSSIDLGKPSTLAATSWVDVNPVANRVEVELKHPERALPGEQVEILIRLQDPQGRPVGGEVTLWLVDQAVLALGKEQRLDPLPDFITPVNSYLEVRDTRSMSFGFLPLGNNPGGDEGEMAAEGILDRATVRKNFKPVPFYDPRIIVGADGETSVLVQLPDNLTNFKIRAKAISGLERFGFAASSLSVRLPLIVQPALPRFVRPGDLFTAAAIGRVVEGEGGPGVVEIEVEGVELLSEGRRELAWVPNRPQRIDFDVNVPTPRYQKDGTLETKEALFRVGVSRTSDRAKDAFEVRLPIVDDRRRVADRRIDELVQGQSIELPEITGEARQGTIRRTVLVSAQPGLVRMVAALSFLMEYPHHCTEQRLSRARAFIALSSLRDRFHLVDDPAELDRAVSDVLEFLPHVIDADGLVAYWPGSEGFVSLTAWSLDFVVEAKAAGYQVDEKLEAGLVRVLDQSLRSDYSRFIDGASFAERCWALAALTRAGHFDPAYAAELARKARYLNLEASAEVLQSFVAAGATSGATVDELAAKLWNGLVVRLYQGNEVFGGLQDPEDPQSGLILPSETRSLAEVIRALAAVSKDDSRFQVLVDGLINLGRGDGWGSTNANASAVLALTDVLAQGNTKIEPQTISLRLGATRRDLKLTSHDPIVYYQDQVSGPASIVLESTGDQTIKNPTVARAEISWIPQAAGSKIGAEASGFVVARELMLYRSFDAPPQRLPLDAAAQTFDFVVGDVVEDHVQIVNPGKRHYVAIVVPLAAGMEPLNPRLATAGREAIPEGQLSLEPTYAAYMDDSVTFYYNTLEKGTFDFSFRSRATVPGVFMQPPAAAEMMYDQSVRGHGNGATIRIVAADQEP